MIAYSSLSMVLGKFYCTFFLFILYYEYFLKLLNLYGYCLVLLIGALFPFNSFFSILLFPPAQVAGVGAFPDRGGVLRGRLLSRWIEQR